MIIIVILFLILEIIQCNACSESASSTFVFVASLEGTGHHMFNDLYTSIANASDNVLKTIGWNTLENIYKDPNRIENTTYFIGHIASIPSNRPYAPGKRLHILERVKFISELACPCCRIRIIVSSRDMLDTVKSGCISRKFSICSEQVQILHTEFCVLKTELSQIEQMKANRQCFGQLCDIDYSWFNYEDFTQYASEKYAEAFGILMNVESDIVRETFAELVHFKSSNNNSNSYKNLRKKIDRTFIGLDRTFNETHKLI